MGPAFEWDSRKAEANRRQHGVAFEEALLVFADPLARIFDDPGHSRRERREIIVGHDSRGRLLLVSFTERDTPCAAHQRSSGHASGAQKP